MASLNITLDSAKVSVYPTAYRQYTTQENGTVIVNPEARLNTEFNIVNAIKHLSSTEGNFVVSYDTTGTPSVLKFYLNGYYFEIEDFAVPSNKNVYVSSRIEKISGGTGFKNLFELVPTTYDSTSGLPRDLDTNLQKFIGLSFDDTNGDLQLFNTNGEVPLASYWKFKFEDIRTDLIDDLKFNLLGSKFIIKGYDSSMTGDTTFKVEDGSIELEANDSVISMDDSRINIYTYGDEINLFKGTPSNKECMLSLTGDDYLTWSRTDISGSTIFEITDDDLTFENTYDTTQNYMCFDQDGIEIFSKKLSANPYYTFRLVSKDGSDTELSTYNGLVIEAKDNTLDLKAKETVKLVSNTMDILVNSYTGLTLESDYSDVNIYAKGDDGINTNINVEAKTNINFKATNVEFGGTNHNVGTFKVNTTGGINLTAGKSTNKQNITLNGSSISLLGSTETFVESKNLGVVTTDGVAFENGDVSLTIDNSDIGVDDGNDYFRLITKLKEYETRIATLENNKKYVHNIKLARYSTVSKEGLPLWFICFTVFTSSSEPITAHLNLPQISNTLASGWVITGGSNYGVYSVYISRDYQGTRVTINRDSNSEWTFNVDGYIKISDVVTSLQ